MFQTFGLELSTYRALAAASLDPATHRVLDVGAASGESLVVLLKLGFPSDHLYGIDILPELVRDGLLRLPGIHFELGDARRMPYPSDFFDLVMESTMFVQLTDEELAARVANEMIRVTRPGGHVLLIDWRYSAGHDGYKAVSLRRVRSLFQVGEKTSIVHAYRGALVPPLGRFLSRFLPSLYFVVWRLLPISAGQHAVLLRKTIVAVDGSSPAT